MKITLSSQFSRTVFSDNGGNASCSAGETSDLAFRKSLELSQLKGGCRRPALPEPARCCSCLIARM